MDIEQRKQNIGADPKAPIDSTDLSAEELSELQAYRQEMLALDEKIGQALAVDVPALSMPELPEIAESSDVVDISSRSKRRFSTPMWLGLAASAALVAVFAGRLLTPGDETVSITASALADEVIAHLDYEPYALQVTDVAVSEQRLHSVVNQGGVEINSGIGLVTYAQSCIINGKTVPHLVIQGKLGPVTLLLMPDEEISSAVPLSGESIEGVLLPVGSGSIAIIGERDEDLSGIEEQVVDSVKWAI